MLNRITTHTLTVTLFILMSVFFVLAAMPAEAAPSTLDEARQSLVDKQATAETTALFWNLKDRMGQGILFGHHFTTRYGIAGGRWSDRQGNQNRSDVKTAVGYFPAVYGDDFRGDILSENLSTLSTPVKNAYARGGIITFSWHANNPLTGGNFNDRTGNPMREIMPGGSANALWKSWLDTIADFANNYATEGGTKIPIIFRPFHEDNGGFWWRSTATNYIAAWRYTVEYLRDTKGVHNLLYAYSPVNGWTSSHYPGDAYVDIIGFDHYATDLADGARAVVQFAEARNKIAAITEFGASGSLSKTSNANYYMDFLNFIKNDPVAKKVAYAMTWTNRTSGTYWVPVSGDIHYNSFQDFFKDPYTIFQNNMPNYYSYASFGSTISSQSTSPDVYLPPTTPTTLDLTGSAPSTKISTVNVTKPASASTANVTITVNDGDRGNEGVMWINNRSVRILFGRAADPANDGVTKDFSFSIPASSLYDGANSFIFKHRSGDGYTVEKVEVSF